MQKGGDTLAEALLRDLRAAHLLGAGKGVRPGPLWHWMWLEKAVGNHFREGITSADALYITGDLLAWSTPPPAVG